MGYGERNTWSQLVASSVGTIAYIVLLVPQLGQPVDQINWVWPMVWTIAGAVVLSIVVSAGWGIVAGARDPDEEHRVDQRDREIEWFGDRMGQALLVLGALAGLVLAMVEAPWFWIGNAIFAGFFLSAFLGGVARLVAYRRGF